MSDTSIHAVGPEENKPQHMQEFHHPPSPTSSLSGGSSSEVEINRLDGVSRQAIRFDPS